MAIRNFENVRTVAMKIIEFSEEENPMTPERQSENNNTVNL